MMMMMMICKPVRQVAPPAVGVASNASCGPRVETEAVFTCNLATCTFDLLTSKWGHGLPCHGLPSCRFSACYALPFSTNRVRTGQTDGQTNDGHQRLMPPPYGGRA